MIAEKTDKPGFIVGIPLSAEDSHLVAEAVGLLDVLHPGQSDAENLRTLLLYGVASVNLVDDARRSPIHAGLQPSPESATS